MDKEYTEEDFYRYAKWVLDFYDGPLDEIQWLASLAVKTEDGREGIQAILDKIENENDYDL